MMQNLDETKDHPRVGGEKTLSARNAPAVQGSPPRGRGKAQAAQRAMNVNRITPAWAGKSAIFVLLTIPSQDHPRVGGEKASSRRVASVTAGSPPRGRGKVPLILILGTWYGITPAWAGKSFLRCSNWCPVRDHPRVGGEKELFYR